MYGPAQFEKINHLPLVVYPGNAGLPSGFAAFGNVPLISKSVWEYESPLPIEFSQYLWHLSQEWIPSLTK